MSLKPSAITALSFASPAGSTLEELHQAVSAKIPALQIEETAGRRVPVGRIKGELELSNRPRRCSGLDRTARLSMFLARNLNETASLSFRLRNKRVGVNIASSRGATASFENAHELFRRGDRLPSATSPITTSGNISSWAAQVFEVEGVHFSHSSTCSSSLLAFLNGLAWLNSDMADAFVVGSSEAPLTPFTIEQMRALGIYSNAGEDEGFPCRPLEKNQRFNSFVLSEAAALFLIEPSKNVSSPPVAWIDSYGYGTEALSSKVSFSGESLKRSMKMALDNDPGRSPVDAIVTHATGTLQGDAAELLAIKEIFGREAPFLVNNKWLLGHSLGSAGAMNVITAVSLLQNSPVNYITPYPAACGICPEQVRRVMVNAAGFGGRAVSLIISAVEPAPTL